MKTNNKTCYEKCRICGDKASGFNLNAFTCEPCKTFFRRNAFNEQKLKCPKVGKCEIVDLRRKCCAKCRLDKCLSIGMKLKDKRVKNQEPLINVTQMLDNEIKQQITNTNEQSIIQTVFVTPKNQIKMQPNQPILNDYERYLIDQAQRTSLNFVEEKSLPLSTNANLNESYQWPERYAKRIVAFCKSIPPFRALNPCDQLAILKINFSEILVSRIPWNYDIQKDGYNVYENEAAQACQYIGFRIYYEQDRVKSKISSKFAYSMNVRMENDSVIRDLIMALTIFKNQPEEAKWTNYFRYYHIMYCNLLYRYLECKHKSRSIAAKKYESIMAVLDTLTEVNENIRQMFVEFDRNLIPGILTEVYDLH